MNNNGARQQITSSRDGSPRSDVARDLAAEVDYSSSLNFLSMNLTLQGNDASIQERSSHSVGKAHNYGFSGVRNPSQLAEQVDTFMLDENTTYKVSEAQNTNNQSRDGLNNNQKWSWEVKQLKCIPMYHPIAPTAMKFEGIPVNSVCDRISNFMRISSITCSYNTQNSARIDCLTRGMVRFAVQLWRGKNQGSIVVEVQHVQGCQMVLNRLKGRLYQAVVLNEQENDSGTGNALNNIRAGGAYKFVQNVARDLDNDASACQFTASFFADEMEGMKTRSFNPYNLGSFALCFTMLRSGLYDQKRLAMNTLCTLTDPLKVTSKEADRNSNILIFGDEYGDTMTSETLMPYFSGIELPSDNESLEASSVMSDDGGKTLQYAKGPFFGAMHLMALRVLSQSLESAAWQREKSMSLMKPLDLSSQFWRTVEDALVYNLGAAHCRPLEAALSAKCIRFLQILEPRILHAPQKMASLMPCLVSAHHYGRVHHLWLEQESEYLIGRLGTAH